MCLTGLHPAWVDLRLEGGWSPLVSRTGLWMRWRFGEVRPCASPERPPEDPAICLTKRQVDGSVVGLTVVEAVTR